MSNFQQVLSELVEERTLEVGSNLLVENEEYIRLTNESLRLFNNLEKQATGEYKKLLSDYERVQALIHGVAMDSAYLQGLKDGVSI